MGADGRSGEAECESQRNGDAETTHLSSRLDRDVERRPEIEIVESLEVRVDLPDARARQGGHLDEEVVSVRTRTAIPRVVSNRTFPTIRRTASVGASASAVSGISRYRLKAPRPTIGAKSAIFPRTTHPYAVSRRPSQVPTSKRDRTTPPPRTRATAYAAMRE